MCKRVTVSHQIRSLNLNSHRETTSIWNSEKSVNDEPLNVSNKVSNISRSNRLQRSMSINSKPFTVGTSELHLIENSSYYTRSREDSMPNIRARPAAPIVCDCWLFAMEMIIEHL